MCPSVTVLLTPQLTISDQKLPIEWDCVPFVHCYALFVDMVIICLLSRMNEKKNMYDGLDYTRNTCTFTSTCNCRLEIYSLNLKRSLLHTVFILQISISILLINERT